jgi:hypothetical protein
MRAFRTISAAPLVTILLACGHSPPKDPTDGKAEVDVTAKHTTVEPTNTKVEMPHLYGYVRLDHPRKSIAQVAGSLALPIGPTPAQMVARVIDADERLADLIDFDAPMEGFLAPLERKDDDDNAAVISSVGVTSFEEARAAMEHGGKKLVADASGLFHVEKEAKTGGSDDEDWARTCWLAPARAPRGARLFCGRASELEILATTVASAPDRPSAADIHAEVYGSAFHGLHRALVAKNARYDRQTDEGEKAFFTEIQALGGDLERLDIDITADATGYHGVMAARVAGAKGALAKTFTHVDKVALPPAVFRAFPKEASAAAYWQGNATDDFLGPKQGFLATFRKATKEDPLPPDLEKATADAISSIFGMSTRPTALAFGADSKILDPALAKLDAVKTDKDRDSATSDLANAFWFEAWNGEAPAVTLAAANTFRDVAKNSAKKHAKDDYREEVKDLTIKAGELPKEAIAFQMVSIYPSYAPVPPAQGKARPAKPAPTRDERPVILLVPAFGGTAMIVTKTLPNAIARAKELLAPKAGSTLADRTDLAAVFATPTLASGFFTPSVGILPASERMRWAPPGAAGSLRTKVNQPDFQIPTVFTVVPSPSRGDGANAGIVEFRGAMSQKVIDAFTGLF